jgi:TPR repeat protein
LPAPSLQKTDMLKFATLIFLTCTVLTVEKIDAQPIAILKQQASSGDVTAMVKLADHFDTGVGVPVNNATAAQLYFSAAKNGDPHAQFKIGTYLRRGLGVTPDLEQSLFWLQKAAKSNNGEHLFALAQMYENGVGTPADIPAAIALYLRAAKLGFSDAHTNLGVLFQSDDRDLKQAIHHYEIGAKVGNPRAQNNLGLMYSRGQGVAQDYDRAFALFEQASKLDLSKAKKNLGVMYENGFGVAFDEPKAHELYRQAGQSTQESITKALAKIGEITDPRINLPPASEIEAVRNRAETGDIVSQYALAMLLKNASAPSAQTAIWMRNAANAGFVDARAKLGLMYLTGRGVPQDYVQAYAWLSMARASGMSNLQDLQDQLTNIMTINQITRAQQFSAEQWAKSLN